MTRLAALLALCFLAMTAVGCGGGSGGVSTKTALPARNFAFIAPEGPLHFIVRSSSETEFRGTGMTSSLNFEWIAQDWQQEEEGLSAEVVFEKIKGAMRRGSSISMEQIKEVERLEGFRWRFLRDEKGFEAVGKPARDPEFTAVFDQLTMGMSPLGLTSPEAPVAAGGSWPLDMDSDVLGRISGAVTSREMAATYKGEEMQNGVLCVKIDGSGFYDPARGFLIRSAMKIKTSLKQRALDERGKPDGPERGFIETANVTVSLVSG